MTIDDILDNDGGGGGTPSPIGTEQNSGDNTRPSTTQPSVGGGMSYVDMFNKLNPYTPPTEEELEKEKKRQKRELLFSAIGDGISAISNLFFTTQYAPNMYSGNNSMTERTKLRYDRLKKERDENKAAYLNGWMKAKQADRAWQRTLDIDAQERQRYEDNLAHRNEREKLADERYDNEQEYKRGRDAAADQKWQQQFEEDKRRANQSHNLAVSTANSRNSGGNSKYYGNFEGKDYKTEADYNAAVTTIAQELGISVTEQQSDGVMKKTKIVRRPIPEVVADIVAKRKRKKPNPMN